MSPGIKPATSWFLVRFVSAALRREPHLTSFPSSSPTLNSSMSHQLPSPSLRLSQPLNGSISVLPIIHSPLSKIRNHVTLKFCLNLMASHSPNSFESTARHNLVHSMLQPNCLVQKAFTPTSASPTLNAVPCSCCFHLFRILVPSHLLIEHSPFYHTARLF